MVEVAVAGGGLAGCLAAWRLATDRPDLRVTLIERGDTLGGNHTWSFHATDLPDAAYDRLAPLIVARWPSHRVRFPQGTRVIPGEYASITSSRLHEVVAPALGDRLRLGVDIAEVRPDRVTCADGTTLAADIVIDARGEMPVDVPLGWQTFLGQELVFERNHGVTQPTIMDATVAQTNGYRFVYVLPFDARTLLVEDTCYADHPSVDVDAGRRAVRAYVAAQRWPAFAVAREEIGSLPLPLGGSAEAFWHGDQPRIGLRAGLFHPTTGYSLPDAVATAELLVRLPLADAGATFVALRDFAAARWRARGFFRLLNRLLFRAARPDQRVGVLAQFYRRPDDLIARFYAARLTRTDRIRLLTGRPPVSVLRAVAHLRA